MLWRHFAKTSSYSIPWGFSLAAQPVAPNIIIIIIIKKNSPQIMSRPPRKQKAVAIQALSFWKQKQISSWNQGPRFSSPDSTGFCAEIRVLGLGMWKDSCTAAESSQWAWMSISPILLAVLCVNQLQCRERCYFVAAFSNYYLLFYGTELSFGTET